MSIDSSHIERIWIAVEPGGSQHRLVLRVGFPTPWPAGGWVCVVSVGILDPRPVEVHGSDSWHAMDQGMKHAAAVAHHYEKKGWHFFWERGGGRATASELARDARHPPAMQQAIAHIALLVRDYDEALAFYVGKLGFRVIEDKDQPAQAKRWVVISPPGDSRTSLLLARASTPQQAGFIGNQAGGRVFLFLQTDDFWRDYQRMLDAGVNFVRPPSEEPYGTVAVFEDLYGNRWDLLEYNGASPYAPAADGRRE